MSSYCSHFSAVLLSITTHTFLHNSPMAHYRNSKSSLRKQFTCVNSHFSVVSSPLTLRGDSAHTLESKPENLEEVSLLVPSFRWRFCSAREKLEHGVKSMKCSFMVPSEVVKIPRAPDTSFLNCKSTKIYLPKPTERRCGDLGQFVSFALFHSFQWIIESCLFLGKWLCII